MKGDEVLTVVERDGQVGIPGGRVEKDESWMGALAREFREEVRARLPYKHYVHVGWGTMHYEIRVYVALISDLDARTISSQSTAAGRPTDIESWAWVRRDALPGRNLRPHIRSALGLFDAISVSPVGKEPEWCEWRKPTRAPPGAGAPPGTPMGAEGPLPGAPPGAETPLPDHHQWSGPTGRRRLRREAGRDKPPKGGINAYAALADPLAASAQRDSGCDGRGKTLCRNGHATCEDCAAKICLMCAVLVDSGRQKGAVVCGACSRQPDMALKEGPGPRPGCGEGDHSGAAASPQSTPPLVAHVVETPRESHLSVAQ